SACRLHVAAAFLLTACLMTPVLAQAQVTAPPAVTDEAAPDTPLEPAQEPEAMPLEEAPPPPAERDASLPHDLSPWGMFMAADWVVKAVMIGLAFASLVTWTVG